MKKLKYLFVLIPLSVIGLVFRFVEITRGVDSATGYYVRGSSLHYFFNGFVFLSIYALLSYAFVYRKAKVVPKKTVISLCGTDNVFNAVFVVISAIALLVSACLSAFDEGTAISAFITKSGTVSGVLKSFDFWLLVFALISVCFFVAFAVDPRKCINSRLMNMFSVAVLLFYMLRMLNVFTKTSSILSRAYDSYTILTVGFFILFFINFIKMTVGMTSRNYLIPFGMCAFYFVFIRIADIVLYFTNDNSYNVPLDLPTVISDLLMGFTALFLVISIMLEKSCKAVYRSLDE